MTKGRKIGIISFLIIAVIGIMLSSMTLSASAAEKIPGDVNGDGSVTLDDIIMVRQYLAGTIELTEEQRLIADIYGKDGKIDLNDAIRMEQYLSGMNVALEKNYHSIIYHNVDNATNFSSSVYNADKAAFVLKSAEKVGYEFIGWYTDEGLTDKIEEISIGTTGTLELYAKWELIEYKINYLYDDAYFEFESDESVKYVYTIEDEFEFEPLVCKTPGYKFNGWFTDKNIGTGLQVTGIVKGTTGEINIYAQSSLEEYSITYSNVDGVTNTNAEAYTIETDTFTINDISKSGYVFKGWYTDEALNIPATLTIVKGSTGNLHFYAKWEKINYTISYNLYGGSYTGVKNPEKYTIEDSITLVNSSLSGHFFVGWYDLAEGGNLVTEIPAGTMGNITLYARYLAFDSKGGSAVNYVPEFGSEGVTAPENPTREHYAFDAWYTNESLTTKFDFTKLPAQSMTLYAKWIPVEYKITYILDDGKNDKNNPETYNIEDAFTFANASKTGYTFNGWYTDAEFTSALVEEIVLGSYGEITLYANFSINKYTISFETNGGTDIEPIRQNYGTNVSAPEDPAKNGYKFVGWYSNAALTSKYTFTTIPAENITLYAKWELVNYKITYNLDSGTNAPQNPKTYNITTSTITLRDPSKTGYTFGGWYTDELFANKITEITLGSYGEKELFAKWDIIHYEIEYIVPEGTTNSNPKTYTIETDITQLVDASRAGYTFGGWFSDSACTVPVTSVAGGTIGKVTIYGKFTANTYEVWLDGKNTTSIEVSFDLNGADGTAPATQTVTQSTALKYPAIPTREDYIFGGWYDNEACEGELFDFTAYLTEDITLYAKWFALDGATAISANGTQSVTLNGTTEKIYRFVPLVSGNISITTEGSLDAFGMLYKDNNLLKQDDDSGEGEYSNFLIVYNVTAGEVYEIRVRGFATATSGTVTLRVSGNNAVADGGTLRTGNQITVTFGESFTAPAPAPVENYKFLGWMSANGTMYTDANGNSIRDWDIPEDSVLYSKWERMEYTITFNTGSGTPIESVKLGYGERLDINQYVTTREGYYLAAWIYNGSPYEATTMPDHDITLIAQWKKYSLGAIKYSGKSAVSVNDTITPELFGASCYAANGDMATVTVQFVDGTLTAGNTITVILEANLTGADTVTLRIENVKVYGMPTLTLGDTSKDYINLDNLVGSWFSASGKDTFGANTTIVVRVEDGKGAGDVATVYVDSIDPAGNVTTEAIENIKLYGKPVITYNASKAEISVNDTLNADLFKATAVDSFGMPLTVSVTRYSGSIYAGNTVTLRISATDSKGNTTNIDVKVKVYGNPTITNATKTDFKVEDSITPETLGITAKDTFNQPLTITLATKSGTQTAGSTMVITATVTDAAGNVKTRDYTVKIYGTPTIDVGRVNIKANEIISLNSFNVVSKDSFGNSLTTKYELLSGIQTGGTYMTYRFTTTDRVGNTYYVDKQIGVYDIADIDLTYNAYNSDFIKLTSKGEEFLFSATDSFGENCTLSIVTANGSSLTAGVTTDIYLVATDKVGNVVKSVLIEDIKVYGTPTIEYRGSSEPIKANANVSVLFVARDSYGKELRANVVAEEHSTVGENFNITVTVTDEAGNVTVKTYQLRVSAESDYNVTLNSNGTYTLNSYNGTETDISIPSQINGIAVTAIASNAFSDNVTARSIIIPSSVTSIGSSAFSGCISLESITIPSSVTSIGSSAFYGCSSLESVTFGENSQLESIGSSVFSGCSGLTSITIPSSVTSIGFSAFSGCSSLESITLPFVGATKDETENTYFGYIFGAVFSSWNRDCVPTSLKEVIITGGTSIYDYAFSDCTGLASITIPSSVTRICSHAFYGCYKLVEVYNLSSLNITKGSSNNGHVGYYALNVYTPTSGASKLTTTPEGYIFYEDGDTVYLLGYKGSETELTLPDKFNGKNYAIYKYAFYNCTSLISITIPSSVTSIGDYAFDDRSGLESVTFGENSQLTSIGEDAFKGCRSLTSITIPSRVTSIGDDAFYGCYKLVEVYNLSSLSITKGSSDNGDVGYYALNVYTPTSGASKLTTTPDGYIFYEDGDTVYLLGYKGSETELTLPDKFNGKNYAIYKYAFRVCTILESITIPSSVTSIGDYAFDDCSGLESVTFGENSQLTSIGDYAFYQCRNLESVTFGANSQLQSIGERAFYGCSSLTSITIPSRVTSIGSSAFNCCYKLVEVYNLSSLSITKGSSDNGDVGYYALNVYTPTSGASKLTTTPDGYIFYEDGDTVYLLGYKGSETELTLPDKFNGKNYEIYKRAFYGCTSLTSITIPSSVTSIGNYAFSDCTSLESVTFGENSQLTSIGDYAFYSCSSLTSIKIPSSVTRIGTAAFCNCSSLTSIEIPSSVTSIDTAVFNSCSSLTNIEIPSSVTSISSGTFYGCSNLIQIENGVSYVDKWVIDCDTSVTGVRLRDNTVGIGDNAFYYCSSLTSITIPSSVTSIGDSAFDGCSSLTSIKIPSGVTSISGCAFRGCSSLTSITIPSGVTRIGNSAFCGCSSLTSIRIPSSVTSIGNSAFCGCSSLTSITIPSSVTSIGVYAFDDCTSLTSITFTDTTTWYRTSSFTDWSNKTNGTQTNVTSANTNATYFKDTYKNYYWYKK